MLAACFLVVQYILFAVLQEKHESYHYYAYIGIAGVFTVPLPFMVGFNGPRRFQWLYQPFVLLATWSTGYLQSIEMVRVQWKCRPLPVLAHWAHTVVIRPHNNLTSTPLLPLPPL